jgi:hypothetical protein
MCVQRFDDSLNSAIHTTFRISLRSSSMPEPRDPLLKVVTIIVFSDADCNYKEFEMSYRRANPPRKHTVRKDKGCTVRGCLDLLKVFDNDPSAGSPTETLLRLLLPLNDRV